VGIFFASSVFRNGFFFTGMQCLLA
jgi:hypothetical protein